MEEFKKLRALIEIERKEDLRQYQNKIILTPLKERVTKGLTWYPVQISHREIGAGENFYLSLDKVTHLEDNPAFQVGDSVSLFNNASNAPKNAQLSGVVASVWRDKIRLSFNVDELPDWLDYGSLGIDLLFDSITYKEMEEALKKVTEAKNDRLAQLREILTGKERANFRPQEELPTYYEVPDLNASQNQAIKNILAARDVAIIHGPPGTGKTTTIVQAVKITLEKESQVLVTAPSNTAVDLLTLRLAEKGLTVLRIGNPARMSEALSPISLEAQIAQHPDFRYLRKLRKQAEDMRKMAGKYKRKFGPREREQRRLLFTEASRLKNESTILENYIINSLLEHAQVITATLVGSVNKYIRNRQFSTVFIDEAAQALEPACWIPICKSSRVIMAGDHCQLPPTVKSQEASREGLDETLFEKVIEDQKVDVMLNVQYRMHEKIMNFSNQEFYKGELKADSKVKDHHLTEISEDQLLYPPLEFIDTAGCSFDESVHPETQSKQNIQEGDLLLRHLEHLLQYIQKTPMQILDTDFSVGVISPYQAQVSYLKGEIANRESLAAFKAFLKISSIDGFQGQEKDIIYLSLVRSNAQGKIGFLNDTRRLNVALTRARKKLIVIGDSATIGLHPFYQRFLNYIEANNAYRSAWDYAE